jgi:hypothetical protein
MPYPSLSARRLQIPLAALLTLGLTALSGCGLGSLATPNGTSTTAVAMRGVLHGGPNPVVGARVVIYATGDATGASVGYGTGTALQTATSDAGGNFSFAGGYTCPANQFAYVVAFGGKTGSNATNPNSVLMTALGPCSGVSSSTFIFINELTTIASAYALNNFMTVTGDAVNGYAVGIGAPATNNASAACVVNAYYPSCTTTAASGLKHAFINATALVSNTTGIPAPTTASGAIVPVPFLNSLGNTLQACVNSGGGGTNGAGAPTTTTSSSGTTHDGTLCGELFAYASYTVNGTPTGTLVAPGNTLSAVQNLAHRPNGSATLFDAGCTSNGTGSTPAATCIFNLGTPVGIYQTAMTAPPPDWMLGISYAKGSFSTSTTNTFTSVGGCAASTSNGLLYPTFASTDINDNIVILNGDASTPACANLIAIGSDGSVLGSSAIDNTATAVVSTALDSWGHIILPVKGLNGVKFYQYAAGGASDTNDASVPLIATVNSPQTSGVGTTSAYKGVFAQVDGNNRIYVAAMNAVNSWGYIFPTTLSHASPVYTTTALGTTTSNLTATTIDPNNNAFSTKSTLFVGTGSGGTTFTSAVATGSTSAGAVLVTDTSNNVWNILNNGSTVGTSQTVVVKFPYTATAGVVTWSAGNSTVSSPTYSFPTNTNTSLNDGLNVGAKYGVIDGNNVIWWTDFFGQGSAIPTYGSFLRGYDTINNFGTSQYRGCKFAAAGTYPITAWTIGASSTTFTISSSSPPAVGASLTLSGFATSTFFNSQTVTVTANTTTAPITFTVANTFNQAAGSSTETGSAASNAGTACGSNSGDGSYPSPTPYLLYMSRGTAVDTMGNLWVVNGTQGTVNELIGIAAPTLPNYIHNGVSNKP